MTGRQLRRRTLGSERPPRNKPTTCLLQKNKQNRGGTIYIPRKQSLSSVIQPNPCLGRVGEVRTLPLLIGATQRRTRQQSFSTNLLSPLSGSVLALQRHRACLSIARTHKYTSPNLADRNQTPRESVYLFFFVTAAARTCRLCTAVDVRMRLARRLRQFRFASPSSPEFCGFFFFPCRAKLFDLLIGRRRRQVWRRTSPRVVGLSGIWQ